MVTIKSKKEIELMREACKVVAIVYQELEKQGIALMGWADPFMPDYSLPSFIEEALIEEAE